MKTVDNLKEKYLELFNKLLKEKDLENQRIIAKEIADFSGAISKKVEDYGDGILEEINQVCLPMEHWKDETGYCNLTELDIRKFIKHLSKKA